MKSQLKEYLYLPTNKIHLLLYLLFFIGLLGCIGVFAYTDSWINYLLLSASWAFIWGGLAHNYFE